MPLSRLAAIVVSFLALSAVPSLAQQSQTAPPPTGVIAEPRVVTRMIDRAGGVLGDGRRENDGWYGSFDTLASGSWVGGKLGRRAHFSQDRVRIDVSVAVSVRGYSDIRLLTELPRLAHDRLVAGFVVGRRDLTQVAYWGTGPDSNRDLRSDYRLTSAELAGYADYRVTRRINVAGRAAWLRAPRIRASTGPLDRDVPDVGALFPYDPAVGLSAQPAFLQLGVSAVLDTRNFLDHPSRGGLLRLAATTFDDRDNGRFSFTQYEAELLGAVPVVRDRWTIVGHGWSVVSDTSRGHDVPFYLMPTLGGANTLRSYPGFRFHDRHLLLTSLESRVALFTHIEAAAFVDAGRVAGRVRDLDLSRYSYGLGLRVHMHSSTLGRLDVARGREGIRVVVSLSDPFGLARLLRRARVAPFIP